MMVVLSIDVHKATHTAVAVDEVGCQLATTTVPATDAGHRQLLAWALHHWPNCELRFAVQDCRAVSTRLERALLAAGQSVVRVPPHLMAGVRRSARSRGKSDPIDALAIARVVLREPHLPTAHLEGPSRDVKLLVDHREQLVATRTRLQNRLRWPMHELDPELVVLDGRLSSVSTLNQLGAWPATQPAITVTRIAGQLLADIAALTARVDALQRELATLTKAFVAQLLALPGCGPLTAAKLYGETANIDRFRSPAAYAMHAGTAPIPASSGKVVRYRLARGGNRQLNAALYRIAITQIRYPGLGQTYYQHRKATGDSSKEALRALKRRLANVVYHLLKQPALT
jgi:transposase